MCEHLYRCACVAGELRWGGAGMKRSNNKREDNNEKTIKTVTAYALWNAVIDQKTLHKNFTIRVS